MPRHSLGFTTELNTLDDLTANPESLQRFRAELDRLAVARIVLATAPSADAVAALARGLGELESPDIYGTPTLAACSVIGDFSAPAKVDDGRPRARTFIENLHVDVLESGWASFGILATRQVPATEPMQWVDMRAVYQALPGETQQRLQGLRGLQHRRATRHQPRPAAFEHPLLAIHPRTAEPLLLLPDRVRGSIAGLGPDESRALVAELWRTVDASAARHSHELRSGELYVWDNLTTVHTNPTYPRAHQRSIWFLNVRGTDELEACPRSETAP